MRVARTGSEHVDRESSDARGHAFFQTAANLVVLGQYDRLTELLAERGVRGKGNRADMAGKQMLDSIRLMCLGCSESQSEAAWHHEALARIHLREQELQQRLKAAICLVHEMSDEQPSEPEESVRSPTSVAEAPSGDRQGQKVPTSHRRSQDLTRGENIPQPRSITSERTGYSAIPTQSEGEPGGLPIRCRSTA